MTDKKRKWDVQSNNEQAPKALMEKEEEDGKSCGIESLSKAALSDSVEEALENAKKIRANLEAVKKSSTTESDLDSFSRKVDVSNCKHLPALKSESFADKLQDKLQLGPNEAFSFKIELNQLCLKASSSDLLDLAERLTNQVMENGDFSRPTTTTSSKQIFTEDVFLGFEPVAGQVSFVRGKLLGPQGSFLKHVQSTTNTRVQLKGRGSGFVDYTKPDGQAPLSMYLSIIAHSDDDLKEARHLCEDLISTVKAEYDAKVSSTTASKSQPPSYPYPYPYPPYAQSTATSHSPYANPALYYSYLMASNPQMYQNFLLQQQQLQNDQQHKKTGPDNEPGKKHP